MAKEYYSNIEDRIPEHQGISFDIHTEIHKLPLPLDGKDLMNIIKRHDKDIIGAQMSGPRTTDICFSDQTVLSMTIEEDNTITVGSGYSGAHPKVAPAPTGGKLN